MAGLSRSLESDPRIAAAWLSGSHGRGTADDLSDIDIWLAVEDDAIGQVIDNPLAFVHSIAPTIMHIQAPSIAPPGGVYLLTWIPEGEGFGQVDWYWTPASAARRPQTTRHLFERRPVPVEDAPGFNRLDDNALTQEVDTTIRHALLMIANTWKHARRGDAWRTVGHFQHVDDVISRLDWLVKHGHIPAFEDPARSFLPSAIPVSFEVQRETLRQLLADLTSLVNRANRSSAFEKAIAALSATLCA